MLRSGYFANSFKLFFYFWMTNLSKNQKLIRMESVDTSKEQKKNFDSKFRQEIHSKVIRAGKRTYFFDVKSTRNDEYYLTITESKKRFEDNGKFHYEKHKIFLYKEDFEKFKESLEEIIDYIQNKQPEEEVEKTVEEETVAVKEEVKDYTNIDFEDI